MKKVLKISGIIIGILILAFLGICTYAKFTTSDITDYKTIQQKDSYEDAALASGKLALGTDRDIRISVKENNTITVYVNVPDDFSQRKFKLEASRLITELQKIKNYDVVTGIYIQYYNDLDKARSGEDTNVIALASFEGENLKTQFNENNINHTTMFFVDNSIKEA